MILIVCLFALISGGTAVLACLQMNDGKDGPAPLILKTVLSAAAAALAAGFCAYRLHRFGNTFSASAKILSALPACQAAAVIDAQKKQIPDRLVFLLLLLRILLVPLDCTVYGGVQGLLFLLRSTLTGAFLFLVFLLFSFLFKGGFGMGDVKLLSAVGFSSGLSAAVYSLAAGTAVCACFAAVMLILKKKELKDRLAFAPFLYLGLLISISLGKV